MIPHVTQIGDIYQNTDGSILNERALGSGLIPVTEQSTYR